MNPRDPADPAARKDAIFLSPHKFIGGPGTPGRPGRQPRAADQLGPGRGRRRHRRLRQPAGAPLPRRPRAPRGGRHARASSSRSGPGWSSRSRTPSAWPRSARTRRTSCAARSPPGTSTRRSRCSATPTPSGSPSSRSSIRRPGGRYLHHNLVVVDPQRPLRHPEPRRLLVRRPLRPPAARHRPRPLPRVRARDHRRLRGDQARLGADQLQLLRQRGRLRVRRPRGRAGRRPRPQAGAAVPLRPDDRPLAAPRRPGRAAAAADVTCPTTPRAGSPTRASTTRRPRARWSATSPRRWRSSTRCPRSTCEDGVGDRVSADFEHLRWFDLPAVCLEPRLSRSSSSRCGHTSAPSSASASAIAAVHQVRGRPRRLAGQHDPVPGPRVADQLGPQPGRASAGPRPARRSRSTATAGRRRPRPAAPRRRSARPGSARRAPGRRTSPASARTCRRTPAGRCRAPTRRRTARTAAARRRG